MSKKPQWVIEKEQGKRASAAATYWLFGLHSVRDALENPARKKHHLVATKNAMAKLGDAAGGSPVEVTIADPRHFPVALDPGSVHQGAALEVSPLSWGALSAVAATSGRARDIVVLLDRVSDPQNVGAVLRSAEVFGAKAVIAPSRHAAPETGALAKAASGALERQPYLRVRNLGDAMVELKALGYLLVGFEGSAERGLDKTLADLPSGPLGLVLGAEGPGLRQRTRDLCDFVAHIEFGGNFGSLNVSNAAAVALYAASRSAHNPA